MNSAVYQHTTGMDAAFIGLKPTRSRRSNTDSHIKSLQACPPQDKSICDPWRRQNVARGTCFDSPTSGLLNNACGASHPPSHIHHGSSSESPKEPKTGATLFCGSIPTDPAPSLRDHRPSIFSEASQSSSRSVISLSSTPITSVQSLNPFESPESVRLSHWDRKGSTTSAEVQVGLQSNLSSRKKACLRLSKIKGLLTEKAKQGIASVHGHGSPASSPASTHFEQIYTRFQGGKADSKTSSTEPLQFIRSTQCTVEEKKLVARQATTKTMSIATSCSQSGHSEAVPTTPITPLSSNGGASPFNCPATLYPLVCSITPDPKEPEHVIFSGYVTENKHLGHQTKAESTTLQPPQDEDTDSSEEEMDSIISGLLSLTTLRKPSTTVVSADSKASIHSSTNSSYIAQRPYSSLTGPEEPRNESVEVTSTNETQLADDVSFDDRCSSVGSLVAMDEQEEVIDYQLPVWPAMSSTIKSPLNTTSHTSGRKPLPQSPLSTRALVQERKRDLRAANRPLRIV